MCQKSCYTKWLHVAVFVLRIHRSDRAQKPIWTKQHRSISECLRLCYVRLRRRKISFQIYMLRRLAVRKKPTKKNSTMTFRLLKIFLCFVGVKNAGAKKGKERKFIAHEHVKKKFYELRQEWMEELILLCFLYRFFLFLYFCPRIYEHTVAWSAMAES